MKSLLYPVTCTPSQYDEVLARVTEDAKAVSDEARSEHSLHHPNSNPKPD